MRNIMLKIGKYFTTFVLLFLLIYSSSIGHSFFDTLTAIHLETLGIGNWNSWFLKYDFKDLALSDFQYKDIWSKEVDGFRSGFGLLFIENPYSEYMITTRSKFGAFEQSQGVAGGYGILFETTIDQQLNDTGYALQFDRGFGGIAIRPRNAGKESNPIISITNSQNSYIPQSKRDPFWTEEHIIKLKVLGQVKMQIV
jgi:hypothetical protein